MANIGALAVRARIASAFAFAMCAAVALVGCFPEHDPNQSSLPVGDVGGSSAGGATTGGSGGSAGAAEVICLPAKAEALPARSEVLSADSAPQAQQVFVKDLFSSFSTQCGACHVESNQGGFKSERVNLQNFATLVDQDAVDAILQTDPTKIMPPSSKPPSTRPATDPILQLASILQKWIDAKRPTDYFWLEPEVATGVSLLKLTQDVGSAMTNLGNCIPDQQFIGVETDKTAQLDSFFEKATELPVNLSDTDLFTLDSKELARYRVVAFAPAYPLWADDAKKVRMVRVPMGQSIVFNKDTQTFTIPTNTRFYKTFLKQVVDVDGNVSFRKIETRLIVSRPDKCDSTGKNCQPQALFGTYSWDPDETKATLVQDLLRDEEPFSDRVITYITDEQKAAKVKDPEAAGVTRHYAIPGSVRCTQCHMGSVSQSFILGFAPLQIRRLPKGQNGIIEDAAEDELNQFQRLIDYGIITGTTSEKDVVELKDSEQYPPRNDYELNAQGYMVGNCGHCHNPRGYPSILHPELADKLAFWPSMQGGIFQFPLDRVSPRLHRGLSAEFDIPYITASIDDADYGATPVPGTDDKGYTPKSYQLPNVGGDSQQSPPVPVAAPWRSLIYRNVDTPFTYTEANTIFPHMPLNTPGYDCRVPQIMGDWMVSIPVKRTKQGPVSGDEIIPYAEVKPGEAFYDQKVTEATARLAQYHAGHRYDFCPNTATCLGTTDIVDPDVVSGKVIVPQDNGFPLPGYTCKQVADASTLGIDLAFKDGIPDRPHWIITDPTEPPGDWVPRRPDYGVALLGDPPAKGDTAPVISDELAEVVKVVGQGSIRFSTEFNDFALKQRPMAYWVPKPECATALASQPKSDDFTGDDRLPWLDARQTPSWFSQSTTYPNPWPTSGDTTQPGLPIYTTSYGATLFEHICRNCHGPAANGQSDLAGTISTLTGGATRVADLRDGLLGPVDMPGANRQRVFAKSAAAHGLAVDDLAVRYLAWMGLGGTQKVIPDAALIAVANSPVFDERRTFPADTPPPPTANMLASARVFCRVVHQSAADFDVPSGWWPERAYTSTELLTSSGDADMWRQLCYFENPGPVWGLTGTPNDDRSPNDGNWVGVRLVAGNRILRSHYPASTPVGGKAGVIYPGLTDDNEVPWCFMPPPSEFDPTIYQTHLEQFWNEKLGRTDPIPYCPDSLSFNNGDFVTPSDLANGIRSNDPSEDAWEIRAAANAGRAVFAYIDSVAKGFTPKPRNFECEQLTGSGQ